MKAIYTNNNISAKTIVGEKKRPKLAANEVLIKVHSSSINPIDWKYPRIVAPFYPFSIILGHDAAGEVVEVGSRVSKFKVGEFVYGCKAMVLNGSYADFFPINQNKVAKIPRSLDLSIAGAVPLVSITALSSLRGAKLCAGSEVLIIGGSGGVGHVAIQIAKNLGLHVTAVCGTRNIEFVKSLGADSVIDYTQENWLDKNIKYDFIFDTVGVNSYRQVKNLLKKNKRFTSTLDTFNSLFHFLQTQTLGRFLPVFNTGGFHLLMPNTKDLEEISAMIDCGKLSVHIDQQFDFKDIHSAIEVSKAGRTRGKNILIVNT